MNIEELKKQYGHLFNIVDLRKMPWYKKIFYTIRSFIRKKF